MGTVFSFDLVDGIAEQRCPLCHAVDSHMRRWLDSFWREGRQDPVARRRFDAGGGFCRRHAWSLHELVADGSGAPIADIYGRLADNDLETLGDLLDPRARRQRRSRRLLQRRARCSACIEEDAAVPRKAAFFLELLATERARRGYESSCGVCFPHLLSTIEAAGEDDLIVRYLLADWAKRLREVRGRLAEFDRKRDYRYAAERLDEEERSWTDVLQLYVGAPR